MPSAKRRQAEIDRGYKAVGSKGQPPRDAVGYDAEQKLYYDMPNELTHFVLAA